MSSTPVDVAANEQQGDRLLWIAAGVVAALALTWLLISQPWSSGSTSAVQTVTTPAAAPMAAETAQRPASASAPAAQTDGAAVGQAQLRSGLGDPLRMAELAYEAGMLTEPEDYSAWTLFSAVLVDDPENEAARLGLVKVAEDLLVRGDVALEQGRFEDAAATAERILERLPQHPEALAFAARIDAATPRAAAPPPAEAPAPPPPETQTARAAAPTPDAPAAEAVREEPKVDPVVALHERFELAMRENRLLTPAGESARDHVAAMVASSPDHALTRSARDLLVTELLSRSTQALEALDTEAAQTWIAAAEGIAPDQPAIVAAKIALTDGLVALEGAKPLPASALTVLDYVPPDYPRTAAARGIEGWVDIEFTVAANGATVDIATADASHERLFRDEAVTAVQQWRFEPRIFMGRAIDQRVYTRLRFVLSE